MRYFQVHDMPRHNEYLIVLKQSINTSFKRWLFLKYFMMGLVRKILVSYWQHTSPNSVAS